MGTYARFASTAFALLLGISLTLPASAQYFGRNKVQYDQFDFRVIKTEHFEIYYYPEEEEAVMDAARMAERWYQRHSRTFLREFTERKPIIFYANDADFQQTNVIGGFIGEGTGGVTEGLKQRVVMPLTGNYAETDHVLGHELVHSFQYDIGLTRSDTIRFAMGSLPLWMMEGMAEYLSVGRDDPHTAMWLRDAVLRDDLPTIDQLTRDMRYFPYRYGQAYFAYIGGKYGDASVANLYKLAGRAGVDTAMVYTIGIKPDSLSKEWIQTVKSTYGPLMEGRTPPSEAGRRVLAAELDAGSMNLSPTISPDGKYVAFLSERDVFNINLFIADAETGEVVAKLKSGNSDPHFDAIRFINTAGTWSPDGKQLAFITFSGGDNEISILDVGTRDVERRFAVGGVTAITNPSWSPDGRSIAFTGLDGGISDLYVLDIETKDVRQLTNDRYADFQPTWSPDGRSIAFVTDRGPGGTNFDDLSYSKLRLGLVDAETREVRTLHPFGRALHHNPQFGPDGRSLYFISDQDGFKDIYRYSLDSEEVFRVTHIATGVSGITATSPAMSMAHQSGRMMFSVYEDGKYSVYSLELEDVQGEPMEPATDLMAAAGILPPVRSITQGLVGAYLDDPLTGLPAPDAVLASSSYRSRLKLDYVAPPSIGIGGGGGFGTRASGGVGFYFSDMLGNRNLAIAAQANGTYKDIGAQVTYLDLGKRFNYGAAVGHIPLQYGYVYGGVLTDGGSFVQVVEQLRYRIFIDQASLIGQYPFTTTRRIEASAGVVRYGFDAEVEQYLVAGTGLMTRRRMKAEDSQWFSDFQTREAIFFAQATAAYVGDYTHFGFVSPVQGGRYRFQIAPQVGTATFTNIVGDYRRYLFFKPLTFAFRGLHIGNYGGNKNDVFATEYLGYAYYPGFLRGYNFSSFEADECSGRTGTCAGFSRLIGTHIAMASTELRLPLFGSKALGLINFPYLPTELSLFADAGVAWSKDEAPVLAFSRDPNDDRRIPVFSAGISSRMNVLGFVILEVFYAYPFQRPQKGPHWGLQLQPGW